MILFFGDDDNAFDLSRIKHCAELEAKCGSPIFEVYQRLANGLPGVYDISETIRIALIGGGMSPVNAKRMIETYVEGQDAAFSNLDDEASPYKTALAVLDARILGMAKIKTEEDDEKKQEAAGPEQSTSPPYTR